MSRVGKKPIQIPAKTEISYQDRFLTVTGAKGSLSRPIHPSVDLKIEGAVLNITMIEDSRGNRAFQGLTRSLVANMIKGVNNGFEKTLEINGIGYRAEIKGQSIVLNLGYSHPIHFDLPEGISANIEKNTVIKLAGIDKELLGHTAAAIRQLRPPEPYKGKGIKYVEEVIRKKAGKTGTK
jgi:large subunit ribosomal protein L6